MAWGEYVLGIVKNDQIYLVFAHNSLRTHSPLVS